MCLTHPILWSENILQFFFSLHLMFILHQIHLQTIIPVACVEECYINFGANLAKISIFFFPSRCTGFVGVAWSCNPALRMFLAQVSGVWWIFVFGTTLLLLGMCFLPSCQPLLLLFHPWHSENGTTCTKMREKHICRSLMYYFVFYLWPKTTTFLESFVLFYIFSDRVPDSG